MSRLRAGIRAHRDARGNERCFLDDEVLYRLLGEDEQRVMRSLSVFAGPFTLDLACAVAASSDWRRPASWTSSPALPSNRC